MQSRGHLFLPKLVHVDLRIVADVEASTASWGWKVSDLLTDELVWVCAHPHVDLLPSGRWLARSLLEGSDIIHHLANDEAFPPKCRGHVTDGAAGAE